MGRLVNFLLIILLLSCGSEEVVFNQNLEAKPDVNVNSVQEEGGLTSNIGKVINSPALIKGASFFDFDEIDYYRPKKIRRDVSVLGAKEDKTPDDLLKIKILISKYPESISNDYFLKDFSKLGLKKYVIKKSHLSKIDGVFSVKENGFFTVSGCIAIYNDILVFKKKGKVTGLVKICFDCNQFVFRGSNEDVSSFGDNNDLSILKSILRSYR